MRIGIVGVGVVGGAVKHGMIKLGHRVFEHDIALDTTLDNVMDTEVCYICVPTPSTQDGRCDTSCVETVVDELRLKGYEGIIAVKSTVEVGTTKRLQEKHKTHNICFVPEFLRERFAVADFIEEHDICVVGTESDEVYNKVKQSHGNLPKHFFKVTPTEAELIKYMNNTYNAALVVLANSFYEVCDACKADYSKVKNVLVNRNHITDMYLDCNPSFRGFGGMCLPKDVRAMAFLCKQMGLKVEFFQDILDENSKHKTTVYDNMRT